MKDVLKVRNITKKFSGVTALDKIGLQLAEGEVMALIGENGAGKSTLLKIMSGVYTDYEGQIVFRDREVQFSSPKDAQDMGIAIIHQELNLIPHLSITQNLFLGRELTNSMGLLDEKAMHHKAQELLERLQLEVSPDILVSSLKVGQQQLVEIAKALLVDASVLFMDEPTSAIGESEVEVLFRVINQLRDEGKSIVYISHKLEELFALADKYVVLRDGQLVGQGAIEAITREGLIELMAGRKVKHSNKEARTIADEIVLKVTNLQLNNPESPDRPVFQKVDFQLRKGEVLGIYGLMGAGRTELCESLFGLHPDQVTGQLEIDGQEQVFSSPKAAMASGLALVPEDRKQDGIVPDMATAKNMSLTDIRKVERSGMLSHLLEKNLYDKHVSALNIKVESENQPIKNLSGGNQQKVILAKWIETSPKVLMLDEPTRGIDINAKNEIYQLIGRLANEGLSILVVSSEIPEIMAVADRILVMSEGRITAEMNSSEATQNKIMSACIPENTQIRQ